MNKGSTRSSNDNQRMDFLDGQKARDSKFTFGATCFGNWEFLFVTEIATLVYDSMNATDDTSRGWT